MSEPVGNSPRDAIPRNSHKERAAPEAAAPVEEREKAEKIVQGAVTTRKTPWYKRWIRSMIADDATSIGQFIMQDVIGPGLRNAAWEIGTGVLSRGLYGAKGAGVRRGGGGLRGDVSSISTRYDRMAEGSRVISREARARHDFGDVVFDDREEAIIVLEGLIERITRFRVATVADLFDLCGVTGSYADRNYGWTDLNTANVRQRYGGWLLDLPAPEPIRN